MSGDTFLCMTSVKKMRQASEATSHFQRGKAKMPRRAQALNESPQRRLVDYSHSFINSSPISRLVDSPISQLNNRITAKKILQGQSCRIFYLEIQMLQMRYLLYLVCNRDVNPLTHSPQNSVRSSQIIVLHIPKLFFKESQACFMLYFCLAKNNHVQL